MVRFVVSFSVFSLLLSCGAPSGGSNVGEAKDETVDAVDAGSAKINPSTRFANLPHGVWPLLDPESYEAFAMEHSEVLLIDLRKKEDFSLGHIPGALQLWRDDITSDRYPYSGMALEAESLAIKMDSIGASPNTHFVIYDASGGCEAARLWWLLRLYGHESVSILDGGLQAWKESGRELASVEGQLADPQRMTQEMGEKFHFSGTLNPDLLATKQEVEEGLASGQILLLDTRTLEEYTGDLLKKGAYVAGHIPGSVHYDWGNAVEMTQSWKLKENAVIRADLERLGITADAQIVTYCHSGVRSAHTTFVLRELLGFPNVKNYDGSWTEWSYFIAQHQPQ